MSASKQDTHAKNQGKRGPTDQDCRDCLTEGQAAFDARRAALEQEASDLEAQSVEAREDAVALLEEPIDARTPEGLRRKEDAALSRLKSWANLAPGLYGLQLFVGLLAMISAGPLMLGVEYSMFFELFKSWFENDFGELSAEAKTRVTLYALQAVVVVFAVKLWAVKPGRVRFLTSVAFFAAFAFVVGAVLKHANTQYLREASFTGGGLSWDTLPTDLSSATALIGAQITSPLLALGFLIVPIVSAVLIGWSWSQIKGALEGLAKARMSRRSCARAKATQRANTKADNALKNHDAQHEAILLAPLNALTREHMENAQHEAARLKTQRKKGETNAADAEAEAATDETLKHLGNGFVKDQHAAWLAERNKGSPL